MSDSGAFFSDLTKSPAVENNISESYNAILKDARCKPIIGLLKDIRRHVMSSNLVKIKEIEKAIGLITPKALAIIENRKKSLMWCHPFSNGRGIYEVDHGRNQYVVNVRENVSCTCRTFDVNGIPCCHIMSVMWVEYKDTRLPETLVSDWYSIEKCKLCYDSLIFPVNGMEMWETHSNLVVMPPPDRIMPGRPKNNDRIRDPSEGRSRDPTQPEASQTETSQPETTQPEDLHEKIVMKYSKCGQAGHNRRTCTKEPINQPNPTKQPSEFPSVHANVVLTCGNCRQTGHNKQKCKLPLVPKPPPLPPGRPSKKQKAVDALDKTMDAL